MKKMDARIIRDMCTEPIVCLSCERRLCSLVNKGGVYECVIDQYHTTPDGIICELCYAAGKEATASDPHREKILLAVDGSDGSMEAVRHVAKVAARKRAEVVLFHVAEKTDPGKKDVPTHPLFREQIASVIALDAARKCRMQKFMNAARQVLLDVGFPEEAVRVEIREKRAGVARDIAKESKQGYSTIVVGRKGASKLRDVLFGNVTAKLLQRIADIPVWVI